MIMTINGTPAVLPESTRIDMNFENPLFTDSGGGYSFEIELPLKGCPENLRIFGPIFLPGIELSDRVFNCEISDGAIYLSGILTIAAVSRQSVKVQFLSGRSEQYRTDILNETKINELNLGTYPVNASPANCDASEVIEPGDNPGDKPFVALPWINAESANLQNDLTDRQNLPGFSYMIYMLPLAERICRAVGMEPDFRAWEADDKWRWLLCCNTLPYGWNLKSIARCLPDWSVNEFFYQLELLTGMQFNLDVRAGTATIETMPQVSEAVRLSNVIEDYTAETNIDEDGESSVDFIDSSNLGYNIEGSDTTAFYNCPWALKRFDRDIMELPSIDRLVEYARQVYLSKWISDHRDPYNTQMSVYKIFYIRDLDTYYTFRIQDVVSQKNKVYVYSPVEVNPFGPRYAYGAAHEEDNGCPDIEINIVPVPFAVHKFDSQTRYLPKSFPVLSFGSYNEMSGTVPSDDNTAADVDLDVEEQTPIALAIQKSEYSDKTPAYYSTIYVGLFSPEQVADNAADSVPAVSEYFFDADGTVRRCDHSLRLNAYNKATPLRSGVAIDNRLKYKFSWLPDTLTMVPDPRRLYLIDGALYVCSKISTQLGGTERNRTISGEFYRVIETL